MCLLIIYRIAGKFGGEFNLAVWRSPTAPPNLISTNYPHTRITQLNFASQSQIAKFKFRQYLISAVGDQIAKYNSRQNFRLYGTTCIICTSFSLCKYIVAVKSVQLQPSNNLLLGHHSLIPCFPSTARILANLPHGMLLLVITIMNIIKI